MDNVDLVKRAWANVGDRQLLFDLLAENAILQFTVPEGATPLKRQYDGRNSVIDFYKNEVPSLVSDGETHSLQFCSNGDRVVILGIESYTIKQNGVRCADKEFCISVEFRDGQIARILQIRDFTELVNAYSSK